jgi:hypothetical protein
VPNRTASSSQYTDYSLSVNWRGNLKSHRAVWLLSGVAGAPRFISKSAAGSPGMFRELDLCPSSGEAMRCEQPAQLWHWADLTLLFSSSPFQDIITVTVYIRFEVLTAVTMKNGVGC